MAQGRVQAPELQGNVALRPAPIQSDTYAAPARPATDNRMASLAQALGAFSDSIGNYAATVQPSKEDKQKAIWAAERKMEGMSLEETRKAIDSGSLPVFGDKWAQQSANAIAGGKAGYLFANELKDQMTRDFDWDNGDPDKHITDAINGYIENSPYKDDPNFGSNFIRNASALREWGVKFKMDRKTEHFVEGQQQSAFDFISTFIDSQAEGTDPKVLTTELFKQLPMLGKAGTLGVNEEALENEVFNAARRIAGTHPEVALAIINHTRKGRDGMDRSFAGDQDKQDVVLQIRATAAKAIGDQFEASEKERIANFNVEVFKAGNGDQIVDRVIKTPDGREVTLTAEAQRKTVEAEYGRQSVLIAKHRKETPTETMFRELRDYRRQGWTHKGLEQTLSGIADMASVDMLGDPESKAGLMNKLNVYGQLRQESKNSIMAYTKEKDRDFAEAFYEAKDFIPNMSDDAALEFAIKVTQPLDAAGREQVAKYQREIDSEVSNLATKKGWFGIETDSDPTNYSTIRTKVSQLAQKIVAAGVKPKDAITMASNAVKANTQVHNGTLLDLNGLDVPDKFPEAVDEALVQFMAANPKVVQQSGLDPEDLTIIPLGGDISGGRFKIVSKDNIAVPLYNDRQEVAVLTLAGIRKSWNERKQEEDRGNLRQDVFDHSAEQKGLVYAVDKDGSKAWVDPKTKEVYSFQYTEKDRSPIWKKTGKRYGRAIVVKDDGGFVLRGFEGGKFWGRLRGSDLKKYREEMKQWESDIDKAAEARRKWWGSILPSIKIGDTVLND